MAPGGALARVRQSQRPEPIEPELLVELAGEPARAPLAWPLQPHRPELDLNAVLPGVVGQRPFGRKQGKLPGAPAVLVEALDHPAPGGVLAVVDLAEVQQRLERPGRRHSACSRRRTSSDAPCRLSSAS